MNGFFYRVKLWLANIFKFAKPKKQYVSRIDKVPVYYTSKGVSYVKPFDIIRSKAGREMIDRMAKDESGKGFF